MTHSDDAVAMQVELELTTILNSIVNVGVRRTLIDFTEYNHKRSLQQEEINTHVDLSGTNVHRIVEDLGRLRIYADDTFKKKSFIFRFLHRVKTAFRKGMGYV